MTKSITKAVVIGATGLVGRKLVNQLQNLPTCDSILVIVRKEDAQFKTMGGVLKSMLTLNEAIIDVKEG